MAKITFRQLGIFINSLTQNNFLLNLWKLISKFISFSINTNAPVAIKWLKVKTPLLKTHITNFCNTLWIIENVPIFHSNKMKMEIPTFWLLEKYVLFVKLDQVAVIHIKAQISMGTWLTDMEHKPSFKIGKISFSAQIKLIYKT